jgi:hypothetical protein
MTEELTTEAFMDMIEKRYNKKYLSYSSITCI